MNSKQSSSPVAQLWSALTRHPLAAGLGVAAVAAGSLALVWHDNADVKARNGALQGVTRVLNNMGARQMSFGELNAKVFIPFQNTATGRTGRFIVNGAQAYSNGAACFSVEAEGGDANRNREAPATYGNTDYKYYPPRFMTVCLQPA